MKKIIFLGLVLSLIGCSTSPVVSNTAKPIPNERVYNQNYLKKHTPEQAKVTFLRDKGFLGSGCTHDIYVNNEKVFSIRSNEIATIYLEPKYYIFRLETGAGMCPNIATSQETEVKPGAEIEYRILLPSDFNLRLNRMK
ncbi:DUF2846 domain-containing protein [Acinetobacter baumannii]|uniref:DUF2846 domain-containing protein n=1 Tax=Acinetobacter baumannii TaxID=470 RepID=UPI001C03D031|nr:DUF2846 domain-containing protein [Acinetobacter baumannii]MBU0383682.1 DUF2846 domain-containing protein [Acinetobacter baumannii]